MANDDHTDGDPLTDEESRQIDLELQDRERAEETARMAETVIHELDLERHIEEDKIQDVLRRQLDDLERGTH